MSIERPPRRGEKPNRTAAEKIAETFRELGKPDGNSDIELMMATLATAMESKLGGELGPNQESGSLDKLIVGLTRWMAWHRSDNLGRLVVVEITEHMRTPQQRLLALERALADDTLPELPL